MSEIAVCALLHEDVSILRRIIKGQEEKKNKAINMLTKINKLCE